MQEAGIKNLGRMGALDNVVDYCAAELGWEARCRVYEKYGEYLDSLGEQKTKGEGADEDVRLK